MAKTELNDCCTFLALDFSQVCAPLQATCIGQFNVAEIQLVGFSMGPLIEITLYIDTKILPTAILSTAFIFGCFTVSAIFSDRRQNLYLTGIASSAAVLLFYMGLMNIFLNSYLIYKVS